MKTTSRIYALMASKEKTLKVLEGMTAKQGMDIVIFRTRIQSEVKKIQSILND